MKTWKTSKKRVLLGAIIVFALVYYFSLPKNLFSPVYSTVLFSKGDDLLGASIADDGQWRFPESGMNSEKFTKALVLYEDEYFFKHPGVNPVSIFRAIKQNISQGRIISGGSTLSMQVIRLSRKKNRTIIEKIWEMILATRLELRFSKDEILSIYMQHAPFGGNVVGLDAASWRYYGRQPDELSWGEAATLAVLPNSPGLIHPGRNRKALREKRDRLLDKLLGNNEIDSLTSELAKSEPIPDQPSPLPRLAPHLLTRVLGNSKGELLRTTLDIEVQMNVNTILNRAYQGLGGNQIHNAAAIVADVNTGDILAYVGNISSGSEHGENVDIIKSKRSTGSLLKPFLFAAMIDEGLLMPDELISDIPLYIDGFNPSNFSGDYDGMVHASEALYRSLNIPAVQLLRSYRYEKLHSLLKELGMSSLSKDAGHYGLSLILGGAEGTLWDLSQMYMQMASIASNTLDQPHHMLNYIEGREPELKRNYPLSRGSIYHTLEALKEVRRPSEEGSWRIFSSSNPIAWKTGTSFGHRDAWAIGITPDYVVGVWTGNADGEGRPGLTGIQTSAPILFDIFSSLKTNNSWFQTPVSELATMNICVKSGLKATINCPETEEKEIYWRLEDKLPCFYHQVIHLDELNKERVTSKCYPVSSMNDSSWFILPPVEAYYYASHHAEYRPIPPLKKECSEEDPFPSMQFIYPGPESSIYIPYELDGNRGKLLLEVAHQSKNNIIYWHIDDQYLGSTKAIHQFAIDPIPGEHVITLIDSKGEKLVRRIKFLERESS